MKNSWLDKLFIMFLCSLAAAIYLGCSQEASFDLGQNQEDENPLDNGRYLLIEHDIKGAHQFYKTEFDKKPSSGNAAVGFAATSLLLLPYDPAVTTLITRLGGSGAIDAKRDVIYGQNGLISLLSQGTPVEDEGGFSGIRSLLGNDLPWNAEELNDADFFNKIDVDFQAITKDLVAISDTLLPIIKAFEVGIADTNFQYFELPGEVFFDDQLTLSINRADLALVTAGLRFVRAATLFISAYEHPYKVSDLGSQWNDINPQDPRYKEGYDSSSYILEYLDPKLFRTIKEPAHLLSAGQELKLTFQSLRKALEIASEEQRFGALAWNRGNVETMGKVSIFLQALENAVDEPTRLPFIEPGLTVDMSVVFKDGRTLSPDVRWFTPEIFDEEDEYFVEMDFNDDAFDFLLEGLFTPRLEDFDGEFSESDDFSELGDQLSEDINDDFNTSFGN